MKMSQSVQRFLLKARDRLDVEILICMPRLLLGTLPL